MHIDMKAASSLSYSLEMFGLRKHGYMHQPQSKLLTIAPGSCKVFENCLSQGKS